MRYAVATIAVVFLIALITAMQVVVPAISRGILQLLP